MWLQSFLALRLWYRVAAVNRARLASSKTWERMPFCARTGPFSLPWLGRNCAEHLLLTSSTTDLVSTANDRK